MKLFHKNNLLLKMIKYNPITLLNKKIGIETYIFDNLWKQELYESHGR